MSAEGAKEVTRLFTELSAANKKLEAAEVLARHARETHPGHGRHCAVCAALAAWDSACAEEK